jgi:hypothetical protein
MDLASERLESVKAGTIAALGASGFEGLLALVGPMSGPIDSLVLVHVVVTGFSGFLFGVTYRYVVRTDRNVHLGQGAILAFGLVRGLTVLEPRLVALGEGLLGWMNGAGLEGIGPGGIGPLGLEVGVILGRSILPFAIAAAILKIGFERNWLKAFSSST